MIFASRFLFVFTIILASIPGAVYADGLSDETLILSNGIFYTGHKQSKDVFVTCQGVVLKYGPADSVQEVGSCKLGSGEVEVGAKSATKYFLSATGRGDVHVSQLKFSGSYAIANWKADGKLGQAVLLSDGKRWHVLSSNVGVINASDVKARGVPSAALQILSP